MRGDDLMFGLPISSFFCFLIWPVVYIVIAVIMYFVMAKHDKEEEKWEEAYEKWQAEGGERK